MLPSHLLRMVSLCISGDYQDAAVRARIKEKCIPFLAKHRREVLAGSYNGRHVRPAGFIRKDGFGITEKARRYLQPLIRGEAPLPYGRDGLPKYVTLKNVAVAKKLPAWES